MRLILNDRQSAGIQILDFSHLVPDITKEEADDFVRDYHEHCPGSHYAVSIVTSLILARHTTGIKSSMDKWGEVMTKAIIILMVAFPEIFDEAIKYSFHDADKIILHSPGPLAKHIAYEILDDNPKINWRN